MATQLALAVVQAKVFALILNAFPELKTALSLFGGVKGLLPFMSIGRKAAGGFVSAGQLTMVGEVGREMFVPQTSGTIVPASALNGGGGQLVTRVSGYDLMVILDRAKNQRGRLGG
jgi:phage-related minor tail protein